ncbi:hypothetical protein [Nostoc sp. NMS4]|uniref:hypothetical protein n=1 Tax=Nostoc sp. NMS4 TaxID=2815390 RepID=UPI0025DE9F74|nr:hypothetical protein [Nostoc sp. NMS4]MBN3925120.1 hypothetical protein [Nostoc sp. NMS4]
MKIFVMVILGHLSYLAVSPSGDAPNVANATLTAVAHGGNLQDRAASPLARH